MLKLLAFVLPLGLDSFAVAAALGAAGVVTIRQRARVSLIFVIFEAGMPLIGVVAGRGLARVIGPVADYLAAAAVIAVGAWMLLARDDAEQDRANRLSHSRGLAVVALGLSISMDELAVGFSLGLVRLPLIPVIAAIAVQTFAAAQLGLALGARIGSTGRERAEQLAGGALILLGGFLIAERLMS